MTMSGGIMATASVMTKASLGTIGTTATTKGNASAGHRLGNGLGDDDPGNLNHSYALGGGGKVVSSGSRAA